MGERKPLITVRVVEHKPSTIVFEKVDLQIEEETRQVVMTFDEETFRQFQENVGNKIVEGSHLELKLRDPK